MKILVSGATGFVGNAISRHLLDGGHEVRAMSRSTGHAMTVFAQHESGRRGLADGRLTFVQADVTKPGTLPAAVTGVDAVIQAAQFAGAPVEDPDRGLTYMNVDRNGTMNLLEAIVMVYGRSAAAGAAGSAAAGPLRFLYQSGISTSASSPYTWDRAKWQAEEALRGSGLDWTIVRCCWAFGQNDTALNRIVGYSDHLPFVPVFGNGQEPLTPVFVEDVGRFYALLIDNPDRARKTAYGLGGPDLVTLDQFLHLALRAMGRARPIVHIPKAIGKVQGAVMYRFPGRPLSPAAVDFVAADGAVSDADRQWLTERFPEFRATPIREGLESYLRPTR
jgi:nucleoside-diphosphate-sugar epimerase